ncbi:hypothetical protein ABMA08_13970 [Pseudomonas yamanorum]
MEARTFVHTQTFSLLNGRTRSGVSQGFTVGDFKLLRIKGARISGQVVKNMLGMDSDLAAP